MSIKKQNYKQMSYMKKLLFLPLLALLISLTACKEKVFTIADNGKTVVLSKGDLFTVQLIGNISTGNKWMVVTPENGIIKQAKEKDYKADSDKTGASGTYSFYFVAAGKGTQKLQMVYGPLNNPLAKPLKRFELTVTVK